METIAETGIIVLLSIVLILHLAIVFRLIPYSLVWGSRIKTIKDMYRLEIISILIISLFLWVALEKANIISGFLSVRLTNIIIWVMSVYFTLNTVGNLFSKNKIEKIIFTPITILLAIFCFMVAL